MTIVLVIALSWCAYFTHPVSLKFFQHSTLKSINK
jgi:hypothetical protein